MNTAALALATLLASASPDAKERIGQPDPTLLVGTASPHRPSPPYRALAITIALLAVSAGALVLKKKKALGADSGRSIEVIASRALSPKVRVVLLRTDGREFLLSVGNEGASLISEWADQTADIVIAEPLPVAPPLTRIEPAAPAPDWSPAVEGLLALRKSAKGSRS